MGCDICPYAQIWDPTLQGWVNASKRGPSFHRSSRCWAALAGVRVPKGVTVAPIVPDRDPPADLAFIEHHDYFSYKTYRDAKGDYVLSDEEGLWWVTLEELLAFDWNQPAGSLGETYYEACRQLVDEYIPWLQTLGEPTKVRLLFTFSP